LENRLAEAERSKLLADAESQVSKDLILSSFAHGPRIAGYEGGDSGCDIVIITKSLNERRTDLHEQDPAQSSPLIVSETVLLQEVRRPSPGESVVSKLLNIYEPILNADFLHDAEVEYKKRVIAERLIEIQSDYGDFSSNLIIPYAYFLFDKLHTRALVHADEVLTIVRTYSGAQGNENLEFTLRGFREAAGLLAAQEIMEKADESVRIFRGKNRKQALSKLLKMYPLTTGAAIQFAFHGLANRAGFEFKTKPLPRLAMTEGVASTVAYDRPKKLLGLEEGVVFDDGSKLVEELARISGFDEDYQFEEKKKGDYINSSKQLELWDEKRRVKFILKHFPEIKSAKWALLNLWSLASKRFNMSPLSRLNREVAAASRLRRLGLKTHRIIGIVLDDRTLVTGYTEGVPLSKSVEEITKGKSTDTQDIEKYGQVLGKLHKAGIVYGDTKPQNALVGKDGIDLLDLEQAVENGDPGWDLAEFLYYSAKISKQNEGMKLVAEAFLRGYRTENSGQSVRKAKNLRYLAPFVLFLTRKKRRVVIDALKKYS
jgi:tRNA A-37 threonylcarbamoyl transferase component Bud32